MFPCGRDLFNFLVLCKSYLQWSNLVFYFYGFENVLNLPKSIFEVSECPNFSSKISLYPMVKV